jgi:autotransporter-associated beta strand protein
MISVRGVARAAVVLAMVVLAAGPAQAEDWSPLWSTTTLSQGRMELTATSCDGKVFFGGGYNSAGLSNVVDIFDAATLTRTTTSLSQARCKLEATSAGGRVFFGGGTSIGGYSNIVDIFDASTLTLTTTNLSQARDNFVAASAGGKVFFGGGGIVSGGSNVVDIFDAATLSLTNTTTLSEARWALEGASANGKVLFGGGYDKGVCSVVDVFDAATLTRTTTSLSEARYKLAATSAGSKVFFAGGDRNGNASNVVDIFDTTSGTWSIAHLSQGRYCLSAASAGNRVFFGGGTEGSIYSNVVDIYTLQNYGTITSTQAWTLLDNTSVAGRMLLNGGNLNLDGYDLVVGSMAGVAPISLGLHTLTAGADGTSSTYSGALSGHGGLTKTGAGMMTLSGTSSYDGTTRVSAGALKVTGSIAASSTVVDGGTLQGTGSVGAITGTSGHLHPGGSPGILASGSLTMSPGFYFDVNLDGPAAGLGYSQLDVTGAVNLGGATLGATLGYIPAFYSSGGLPDLLYIIKNDGADPVTGQFAGLPQMSMFDLLYNGTTYKAQISYQGDFATAALTGGNDVVVALPEPATLSLLALGGLLALRRRR